MSLTPHLSAFPAVGGLLCKSAKPQAISLVSGAVGTQDLFTVPAGKRMMLTEIQGFTTAGSATARLAWHNGSTYYYFHTALSLSVNVQGSGQIGQVFEAGEVLAVTISTNTIDNLFVRAIMWDAAEIPLSRQGVFGLANGDNTIYTAPAGKVAWIVTAAMAAGWTAQDIGRVTVVNASGGSRNYVSKYTPSGGSTLTLSPATSVADAGVGLLMVPPTLNAGDVITLNTNSGAAGQFAGVIVFEFTL